VILDHQDFRTRLKEEKFIQESFHFYQNFTGTIELVREQNKEIYYFPILPYAEALSEQQQKDTFANMPIGPAKAKLDYFMGECNEILQTMKNEYLFTKTFRYIPVVGPVAKHLPLWKTLAFYMVNIAFVILKNRLLQLI